ncbi:MAG: type II secretion system protein [bacterium]
MTLRGFTLIELLIVMTILGILSTIGIGNFQTARIKARDLTRKSDLSTIAKSLEAYVNDHHGYPLSDSAYKIQCKDDGSICNWDTPFTDTTGTVYVSKLPSDPSGFTYVYFSNDGTNYTLYAHLENSQDPSLTTFTPEVMCGSDLCNYKINSSNIQ